MTPKTIGKMPRPTITLAVACSSEGREFFGSPDGVEFRRLTYFPPTYEEAVQLLGGSARGAVTIDELHSRYRRNLAVVQVIG